jgi:xanthine dehydrogenase small subunit
VGSLQFLLNGRSVLVDQAPPQTTLLDFIRARGLTGAKEGCAEGECGACAVALVEHDDDTGRSMLRVVNSCLMFLPMAAGREVLTIESLARDGELSDAQRAMASAGGSQCGYCTPGFVMSLHAEQHRPGRDGACDVKALAGNLCRCTGYRPIRDAALSLGPPAASPILERLQEPAPELDAFAVAGFSRPSTVEDCLTILKANPDARVISGATDLAVESNLRHTRWPHLVSIDAIDELRDFSDGPGAVSIGAGLPLSEIDRRWKTAPEAIREWLELFASPLIRNRATLGGNLATASPIGDAAPLLLALDAVLHLAGGEGRRTVPLSAFFTSYRRTAMIPGELIVGVDIPKPLSPSLRFYKIAKRRLDDISTVAAGIAVDVDKNGRVARARLAFGGVAATPVRVIDAETALVDQPWSESSVERVQLVLDRVLQPLSDHRGSREYRLEVCKSLIEKYYWDTKTSL